MQTYKARARAGTAAATTLAARAAMPEVTSRSDSNT